MAVSLSRDVLFQYTRFTLFNSPYNAHDAGCAIDLYPDGELAPSPVSGEVIETKQVTAPSKPYAAAHDYLILIDTGEYVARLLHVEPTVESGEMVTVGDPLGPLVRAGFFAPWVPNHIHLGFRAHDANHYRASGSLPIRPEIEVEPLPWDGTGTVTERGETWVRLDAPEHPAPGERFVGLESDGGILDGGFPHYEYGGLLGGGAEPTVAGRSVGNPVPTEETPAVQLAPTQLSAQSLRWNNCTVTANGHPVTGIALYCARDSFGIKLVGEDIPLSVGEDVTVDIE